MATTTRSYLDSEGLSVLIELIQNYITKLAGNKLTGITYNPNDNTKLILTRGDGETSSLDILEMISDYYLSSGNIDSANGKLILSLSNNGAVDDDKTIEVDLTKWVDINKYYTGNQIDGKYLKSETASKNYLKINDAVDTYVSADGGILSISTKTIDDTWQAGIA